MKQPSWTQGFRIHGAQGDLKGYLRVSEDPATRMPTHVVLTIAKDGTMSQALASAWTEAVNLALEHGATLAEVVERFLGWKFDPFGPVTGSDNVSEASSVLDYIAQELRATYLREA